MNTTSDPTAALKAEAERLVDELGEAAARLGGDAGKVRLDAAAMILQRATERATPADLLQQAEEVVGRAAELQRRLDEARTGAWQEAVWELQRLLNSVAEREALDAATAVFQED